MNWLVMVWTLIVGTCCIPIKTEKEAYITKVMKDAKGPAVAATDYMKLYADQVRAWVPTSYRVLGTDGLVVLTAVQFA